MLQIIANEKKCIELGRRGEDSAREILFDITGWAEMYGQGEVKLIAKRYKDLNPYPVVITHNNTTVSWVVKPVDNDIPGYGECELVYITDGSVVKSIPYQTHTDISLSDPVQPPDSPTVYGLLEKRIGNPNDLTTKEKGCMISAINEIDQKLKELGSSSEGSGIGYKIGKGLKVEDFTLSVDSAKDFEGDNTLPASVALIQSTLGNIKILLDTI